MFASGILSASICSKNQPIIYYSASYYQCYATSQQLANGRPLPQIVTNDSVAVSQLLERRRQGHWCLSLAVPRHTVVDSISSPHPWYLNHKGERFISLLGEEGGSCLSERACWIKGVISPEGGIWEWVSLKTALILTQPLPLHVAREPQLWLLPLSPFPHVILSVCFYPPQQLLFLCLVCTLFLIIATIPSRSLPSSPAGSVLPYREWRIAWFGGWLLFQSHLWCSEGPVK